MLKRTELKLIGENELEKVSGGYVYGGGILKGKKWEVIDDGNGNVLGRYETEKEAKKMAGKKSQSKKELSWKELCDLREVSKPHCPICPKPHLPYIRPIILKKEN